MDKYSYLHISPTDSLLKAFQQMDEVLHKLLIVVDDDIFVSLLSVGDIQRYFINTQDLNAPIEKALRKNIIVGQEGESMDAIKRKMIQYRTEYMPVISNDNEVKNIIFWKDIFTEALGNNILNVDLPVVIMAGGFGTRLRPITHILPKPLLPLGEKTIVEEIMKRFAKIGVNKFLISVNYKSEMIEEYLLNNVQNQNGYFIECFKEEKPLGTAGSLHLLRKKINSSFFVSNCDILIDQDLGEFYQFHKESQNELSLVGVIKNQTIPYGTLEVKKNGILKALNEKPELNYVINAGLYILEPHLFDEIPNNEFYHITHLIEKIIKRKGKVGVFPVSEHSWSDIGEWSKYRETLKKFGYQTW